MSVSLLYTNVQVTGSSTIFNANFSGIGGTIVIQSGSNILVSGGAGGGGGGTVTQGQLDSLSGFTTGISGYLQQQIANASAGVVTLNGLSGMLNLAGTGGISIRQAGSTIFISGNNWTTSGDLFALSGWANITFATITTTNLISGNLIQTGVQLGATIASTGQQAWTHGQNNALNLSGNLANSGAALIARDLAISGALQTQINEANADVSSINGQSGVLTLMGTGLITVLSGGLGLIVISGDNSISGALSQTGSTIWNALLTISGNLASTGSSLQAQVNTLTTNLTSTGATVWNALLNLSGGLGLSGQALYNYYAALSGALSQTGAALIARDAAISGGLEARILQSGQAAWISANGAAGTLSGQLTTTGQTLLGFILTNSGLAVPTGTILSYLTGVATGWDTGYYSYLNHTFSSIPRVEVTMELSGTNTMYGFVISGRSTSGFYALYTDVIAESGIFLNVFAKN